VVPAGIQDQKDEMGRKIISNVEKIIMPLLNDLAVRESLQEIASNREYESDAPRTTD